MCDCNCEYSYKIKMLADEQEAIKKYINEQLDMKFKVQNDNTALKLKQWTAVITGHDKEIYNWVHTKIDNAMLNIKDKCKVDPDWESE